MNTLSAFFLLSFINIYEAQAAALKDFYQSRRRSTSASSSSFISSSASQIPSPPATRSCNQGASSSPDFCYESSSQVVLRDVVSPDSGASTSSVHDMARTEQTSAAPSINPRGALPQSIDVPAQIPAESSAPPWLASPNWALFSYSADEFPPPTATLVVPTDTAVFPTQTGLDSVVIPLPTASDTAFPSNPLQSTADPSPSIFSTPSETPSSSSTPQISDPTSSATSSPPTSTVTEPIPSQTLQFPSTTQNPPVITTSSSTSQPQQATPHQTSSNRTTAIAAGVTIPVALIIILSAVIFAMLRRRRRTSSHPATPHREPGTRFAPAQDSPSPSQAGLLTRLRTHLQPSSNTSTTLSPAGDSEKALGVSPIDPPSVPPPTRRTTAIISSPGRLASPSRKPRIEPPRHIRVNSSQASLEPGHANPAGDFDFSCRGAQQPRPAPSWSSKEVVATSELAEAAALAANPERREQRLGGLGHRRAGTETTDTSWFDESAGSTPRHSFPVPPMGTPEIPVDSTFPPAAAPRAPPQPPMLQTQGYAMGSPVSPLTAASANAPSFGSGGQGVPPVPRLHITDEIGNAVGTPSELATPSNGWWGERSADEGFDGYPLGVAERDFALGVVREEQGESARTSISLSSGPWSEDGSEIEDEAQEEVMRGGRR